MKAAIWGARLLLAALFFYAGLVKAGASENFAMAVTRFSLLPAAWVDIFSLALPATEMLVAILLAIPRTARFGAGLVAGLLTLFIGAIAWALSQNLILDCDCFGGDAAPSRAGMIWTIVRDAGLLALTLALALRRIPPSCTPGTSQKIPASAEGR